jgi:uncharacterized protein YjbI with pentapeptide repeats
MAYSEKSNHEGASMVRRPPRPQFVNADFTSAMFFARTDFSTANFNGVEFKSAQFAGSASFESTRFTNSDFQSVMFSGYADFESVTFVDFANFLSAVFSKAADFDSAKFYGGAYFNFAVFSDDAGFVSAAFSDMASFEAATFSSSIHFFNANFGGNTIFADARFKSRVPDFRGATLHEATEWHGVTWPGPPETKHDAQKQVYAYERLKQETVCRSSSLRSTNAAWWHLADICLDECPLCAQKRSSLCLSAAWSDAGKHRNIQPTVIRRVRCAFRSFLLRRWPVWHDRKTFEHAQPRTALTNHSGRRIA